MSGGSCAPTNFPQTHLVLRLPVLLRLLRLLVLLLRLLVRRLLEKRRERLSRTNAGSLAAPDAPHTAAAAAARTAAAAARTAAAGRIAAAGRTVAATGHVSFVTALLRCLSAPAGRTWRLLAQGRARAKVRSSLRIILLCQNEKKIKKKLLLPCSAIRRNSERVTSGVTGTRGARKSAKN